MYQFRTASLGFMIFSSLAACTPAGEATLDLTATTTALAPGEVVRVHLTATDEEGKVGHGTVEVSSDIGSLTAVETITLDAYGTGAVDFSCPGCTANATITAIWKRSPKPLTAELTLAHRTGAGGGGGSTFSVTPARIIGPTPYRSRADSPFGSLVTGFEDFEDSLFNLPGATANGEITSIHFPDITDSVDGDDGIASDGKCTRSATHQCDSLFFSSGTTGITVTFSPPLPTFAGLVWTDGQGVVSFEAFDANGAKIGSTGPHGFPDAVLNNTTAEDRFFGATSDLGVSSIHVYNSQGGIEVDHVQYGR